MAGWPARYECEFEPKTVGPNEATRAIACMTKTWFHRPLQKKVVIRGLARLRWKLTAACRLGNTTEDVPSFFIDLHVNIGVLGTTRHQSGTILTGPFLRKPMA